MDRTEWALQEDSKSIFTIYLDDQLCFPPLLFRNDQN